MKKFLFLIFIGVLFMSCQNPVDPVFTESTSPASESGDQPAVLGARRTLADVTAEVDPNNENCYQTALYTYTSGDALHACCARSYYGVLYGVDVPIWNLCPPELVEQIFEDIRSNFDESLLADRVLCIASRFPDESYVEHTITFNGKPVQSYYINFRQLLHLFDDQRTDTPLYMQWQALFSPYTYRYSYLFQ